MEQLAVCFMEGPGLSGVGRDEFSSAVVITHLEVSVCEVYQEMNQWWCASGEMTACPSLSPNREPQETTNMSWSQFRQAYKFWLACLTGKAIWLWVFFFFMWIHMYGAGHQQLTQMAFLFCMKFWLTIDTQPHFFSKPPFALASDTSLITLLICVPREVSNCAVTSHHIVQRHSVWEKACIFHAFQHFVCCVSSPPRPLSADGVERGVLDAMSELITFLNWGCLWASCWGRVTKLGY